MIREEEDVGLVRQSLLFERVQDTTDVPVEVLDHSVVAREVLPGRLSDAGDVRHVGSELDGLGVVFLCVFRRRDIGIVGRLNG